jgi:fatty-acyl-CoA synthase
MRVDRIDQERLSGEREIVQLGSNGKARKIKEFVRCGRLLPGFEAEIRDGQGRAVPPGQCGTLYLRGPSIMKGYFNDPEATKEVLSEDGWLNTGDIAYFSGDELVITGRSKDLIIVNGRNIWPQDLEYLAEAMEGVRRGDSCAFSITDDSGKERAILVVQVRDPEQEAARDLAERLKAVIVKEIGIDCHVEVVPRNTLVKTTSGKTSRHGTKKQCLKLGVINLS